MQFFRYALVLLVVASLHLPATARSAAIATADLNNGYSGKVLDKVCNVWAPPPSLKGNFTVSLTVSLDEHGKVTQCKPTKSSEMEALDISACGAVQKVGNFGTPPYNAPIDVYLTFWTGTPRGKAKTPTPSSEEALRAEVISRTKAEQLAREQRADAAEEKARERALVAAKATGKDLPDVQPARVAPPSKTPAVKPADARKDEKKKKDTLSAASDSGKKQTLTVEPAGKKPVAAPAEQPAPPPRDTTQHSAGLTDDEMRLTLPDATPPAQAKPAPPVPRADVAAPQPQSNSPQDKYLRNVTWDLRTAVIIPKETAPGAYFATVKLTIDSGGAIKQCELTQGSGDALLDKYVLRSITRKGHVPPPPAGFGNTLDITLKLVRRPTAN